MLHVVWCSSVPFSFDLKIWRSPPSCQHHSKLTGTACVAMLVPLFKIYQICSSYCESLVSVWSVWSFMRWFLFFTSQSLEDFYCEVSTEIVHIVRLVTHCVCLFVTCSGLHQDIFGKLLLKKGMEEKSEQVNWLDELEHVFISI